MAPDSGGFSIAFIVEKAGADLEIDVREKACSARGAQANVKAKHAGSLLGVLDLLGEVLAGRVDKLEHDPVAAVVPTRAEASSHAVQPPPPNPQRCTITNPSPTHVDDSGQRLQQPYRPAEAASLPVGPPPSYVQSESQARNRTVHVPEAGGRGGRRAR